MITVYRFLDLPPSTPHFVTDLDAGVFEPHLSIGEAFACDIHHMAKILVLVKRSLAGSDRWHVCIWVVLT